MCANVTFFESAKKRLNPCKFCPSYQSKLMNQSKEARLLSELRAQNPPNPQLPQLADDGELDLKCTNVILMSSH